MGGFDTHKTPKSKMGGFYTHKTPKTNMDTSYMDSYGNDMSSTGMRELFVAQIIASQNV